MCLLVSIKNKPILVSTISSSDQIWLLPKLLYNKFFQHCLKETKQETEMKRQEHYKSYVCVCVCVCTGQTKRTDETLGAHLNTYLATRNPPTRSTADAGGQTLPDA